MTFFAMVTAVALGVCVGEFAIRIVDAFVRKVMHTQINEKV